MTIQEEIKKLVEYKATEVEWELAEAMACKPWAARSNLRAKAVRDDINRVEIKLWFYLDFPFMQCKTFMQNNQLRFELERIDDVKIITQ